MGNFNEEENNKSKWEQPKEENKWKEDKKPKKLDNITKWENNKKEREELTRGLEVNPDYHPSKFDSNEPFFSDGAEKMPKKEREAAGKIRDMWDKLTPEQQSYMLKKDNGELKDILGIPRFDYSPMEYNNSSAEVPHRVLHPEAKKLINGHAFGNNENEYRG